MPLRQSVFGEPYIYLFSFSFLLYRAATGDCVLVPWVDGGKGALLEEADLTKEERESEEDFSRVRRRLLGGEEEETAHLDDSVRERRSALVSWLSARSLEARKGPAGRVVVQGVVSVRPPYRGRECCESTNEVALDRVRDLLEQFSETVA